MATNQKLICWCVGLLMTAVISGEANAGAAFNTQPVCLDPNSATIYGTAASTGPALSGEVFNYGTTSAYGMTAQPSRLGPAGAVTTWVATLTGLSANTTYHYQFAGTFSGCGATTCTQGADLTFRTCAQ